VAGAVQETAGLAAWLPAAIGFEVAGHGLDSDSQGCEIPGHNLPDAQSWRNTLPTPATARRDALVLSLELRWDVARGHEVDYGHKRDGQ
jgi:hypothetical protein